MTSYRRYAECTYDIIRNVDQFRIPAECLASLRIKCVVFRDDGLVINKTTMQANALKRKVLFIINKTAGARYSEGIEKIIASAGLQYGADCTIEFTQNAGHATVLAKAALRKNYDQVVAVGGDGTSNEVAQGLVNTTMPMGIIPAGSGNGLARHLGISLNNVSALDQFFNSRILPIDTFTINGKLSLNVSGIGFDGHITNLFGVKGKRGLMGYVKLAIHEFLKFNEFDISFESDHHRFKRSAFIVAVANSSQYGNNAKIAPSASVRDGLLHLNIVHKIPLYRMDFVVQLFTGKLQQSSFCEIIEFQQIHLKTTAPIAFHVDGEPGGLSDTFDIRVQRNSLYVMAPDTVNHVDEDQVNHQLADHSG